MLKLEKPLVFNDHVGPVSLPQQDEEFEGEVVLSGWGSVSKKVIPSLPKVLQYAEMPLVDYETCKKALGTYEKDAKLYKTQICTGPITKTTSACSVSIQYTFCQNFGTIFFILLAKMLLIQ